MNIIPEVAIAQEAIDDFFYWGVGIWGTAGMGVDYRGTDKNMNMVTTLQLMQFGVPLSVKVSGLSFGVAPILQYGALDINYAGQFQTPLGLADVGAGAGIAQDFGFGINIGMAYDMKEVGINGLTFGASYKSAIDMKYKEQLSSATEPFVAFGAFDAPMKDNLQQPAEIGLGFSYAFGGSTIAFDYKQIRWADAKGYEDFGWENQNVFIVGYEYATKDWAARLGYNYGSNPVEEQDGTTQSGAAINMFNLVGFPATTESHVSVGGTYALSSQFSIDGAFTYAFENTEEYDVSGLGQPVTSVETKHSQTGVSVALVFDF
jgi:long-chain fatty acid transport protein